MNFKRKYPKFFKVNLKPNFISNIPNYIETNQANRLPKFFSLETDELRITHNCLELNNKKQVSLKFRLYPWTLLIYDVQLCDSMYLGEPSLEKSEKC